MPEEKKGVDVSATPAEETATQNENADTTLTASSGEGTQNAGVTSEAEKEYTKEELNKIMHERTKDYSERLKSYEEKMQELETKINSFSDKKPQMQEKNAEEELTPEDKQFLDYFKKKIMPLIKDELTPKQQIEYINAMMMREEIDNKNFLNKGETFLKDIITKQGLDIKNLDVIKDMVASNIMNDEEMTTRFKNKDSKVFEDAYNKIIGLFKKTIDDKTKENVKKVINTKEKMSNIKQPVKDGIGVGTTVKKKLSDEELLDLAFKKISQK